MNRSNRIFIASMVLFVSALLFFSSAGEAFGFTAMKREVYDADTSGLVDSSDNTSRITQTSSPNVTHVQGDLSVGNSLTVNGSNRVNFTGSNGTALTGQAYIQRNSETLINLNTNAVGIAETLSVGHNLTVVGMAYFKDDLSVSKTITTSTRLDVYNGTLKGYVGIDPTSDNMDIATYTAHHVRVKTNNIERVNIDDAGDISIRGNLTITGTAKYSNGLMLDAQLSSFLTMTTNQTLTAAGNNINWGAPTILNDITYNTGTHQLSLTGSNVYILEAGLKAVGGTATMSATYGWYDRTNGRYCQPGALGQSITPTITTVAGFQPMARAVYAPASNCDVELRIQACTNVSRFDSGYSYAYVRTIKRKV